MKSGVQALTAPPDLVEVGRLKIGNEAFLVSSLIERCPQSMMLRELVKNALEAAEGAVSGGSRVEISATPIDGVSKLAIWNTGRGMDGEELHRMCDLASSVGKTNALGANFGMGAKVATLPANPLGVRYRSCRQGRVRQVLLGKRDGVYGRVLQSDGSGRSHHVVDVTVDARVHRDLSFDWTEVVLLGRRPDQDTVRDPYDGQPQQAEDWIAQTLFERFFALSGAVTLTLSAECNISGESQKFLPLAASMEQFARHERVETDEGLAIHYIYDAPDPEHPGRTLSERKALQGRTSGAALVHRGELYDRRPPWSWKQDAPVFGAPFGARLVSVLVELPDDYPLTPDGYRQFLRHAKDLQRTLEVREFAPLVLRHRPPWFIDLMQSLSPGGASNRALSVELSDLFRSLGVRRRSRPSPPATPPPPGLGQHALPLYAASDGVAYEVAPEILLLRDQDDIRERGLEGKAARYYAESHQLFVNTLYLSIVELAETLAREHGVGDDPEATRRAALQASEQTIIRQICRTLVFGLAKRGTWHDWEVDQATSPLALSLAAEDGAALLPRARKVMDEQTDATRRHEPAVPNATSQLAAAVVAWAGARVSLSRLSGVGLDVAGGFNGHGISGNPTAKSPAP